MMIGRNFLCGLSLIVLSVSLGNVIAHAQSAGSTTANITGNVLDEQKAVIPGASVKIKNLDTNFTREVFSEEDGSYLISQLPPGNYELTAMAEGFAAKTSKLNLELGTTILFNFIMQIGVAGEVIEVKAADTIDTGKTESSVNIDRQRIDALPINRRNFLDFSLTSARVVADRGPVQGASATSGLSFNGQSARSNNITIDGLDNNDALSGSVRSTFSQDAVQEFQIISDSYSAEFGRALGGVINIVTRSGTNEFHSTAFGLVRNDEISARDVFASIKPDYKQYQFGLSLGGPIKRDKAFLFSSFERLTVKQNNIVTISDLTAQAANRLGFELSNGPNPFSLNTTSFLIRSDFRLSPEDSFRVRYNFGGTLNGSLEPFGGLIAKTNAGIQDLSDNTIAGDNTYISAGLNLVNETRFLYGRRRQNILPLEGGPLVTLVAAEGMVAFGRNPILPQSRSENIYQIVNNVSLTRGRHQIKFGADFSYINVPKEDFRLPVLAGGQAIFTPIDFSQLLNVPNLPSFSGLEAFDPSLRSPAQRVFLQTLSALLPVSQPDFPKNLPLADLSLPLVFVQGFGDSREGIDTKFFTLFVQDDIKLTRNLLLKAGLRYDLNRTRFAPANRGELSPRISLAYRPPRLPKASLRASYGLFFATPLFGSIIAAQILGSGQIKIPVIPFPFSILPFAMPGHRFPESNQLPPGVVFVPQFSQTASIQPDLKDSYSQQISCGFDYFLGQNATLSLTYDFVRGIRLFAGRNINPVVRPVPGDPTASLLTGRVDPTKGIVNEFESAFDSYYHAFTISVNKKFSNRFGFLAHYTFSKSIDLFSDLRLAIQEAVDTLKPGDERALSLQDARSRFSISGVWELSYTKNRALRGFELSGIFTTNSGRPFNLLAGVDLNMNGDNPAGDRPIAGGVSIGRNLGITPGFANMDLRLTKSIIISERFKIQAIAEVFNLFNRVNISDIDRIFPPDSQGAFNLPPQRKGRYIASKERFRNAFSPRQFQLGFRLTF